VSFINSQVLLNFNYFLESPYANLEDASKSQVSRKIKKRKMKENEKVEAKYFQQTKFDDLQSNLLN
jgi:hypothetical protein